MSALFHSSPDRVAHPCMRTILAHLALLAPTAVMLSLAFPEPGWGWMAHIALVPATLLAAWAWRLRRLLWTGFICSWVWWLLMIMWMSEVTGIGYVVLAAYLAVYWPVYLACWRRVHRAFRLPAAISVPLVWVSLEYVRGFMVAGGFAWFSLGHSQLPYSPTGNPPMLAQSAALFGEWTVSFLVAMTNGLLVDIVSYIIAKRRTAGTVNPRKVQLSFTCWAVAFGGAFAYGFISMNTRQSEPPAYYHGPVVAIIQTNVDQDNKRRPTPKSMEASWQRLASMTRQAARHTPKPDVIVWPETMVPAPLNAEAVASLKVLAKRWRTITVEELSQLSNAAQYKEHAAKLNMTLEEYRDYRATVRELQVSMAQRVSDLVKEVNTHVIVGAQAEEDDPTQGSLGYRRYNCAYLYLPDGSQSIRYAKIYRVPFGEYVPWVEDWPWLKELFLKYISPIANDYTLTPGTQYTVFDIPYRDHAGEEKSFRVTTPICFEDAVARFCRRMVYDDDGKRCDVMFNLTNDGWYAGSHQGPQHFQIAAMRCIENRVPMARAVNTGVSGFIASDGRVGPIVEVDGLTQQVAGFEVHRLERDDRGSLFAVVGVVPISLLAISTGVLVLIGVIQRKKVR